MKQRRITMSAYSQAAGGFVVSDRVTLMLNTLNPEARRRILARAYDMFYKLDDTPLTEAREEQAAKAVEVAATEIAVAFKRRQKQSREARSVGRENILRASNDGREMPTERREEKIPPTPPIIKEESKEIITPKPPTEKRSVFQPPKVEDVEAYCKERNNGINAQSFIDFYTAKGWMIGSTKMKDCRAAVRTWESRRKHEQSTFGQRTGFSNVRPSTTAGNFRSGTADQRAEAETVL
jgi:hypothetical protein